MRSCRVGLLLSDYLVALSIRSMLGGADTVQPGLRKLRRAGVVPALCSLLVAEAAPANGVPADGSASGNFRVTQALLLVTQFVGQVYARMTRRIGCVLMHSRGSCRT